MNDFNPRRFIGPWTQAMVQNMLDDRHRAKNRHAIGCVTNFFLPYPDPLEYVHRFPTPFDWRRHEPHR